MACSLIRTNRLRACSKGKGLSGANIAGVDESISMSNTLFFKLLLH